MQVTSIIPQSRKPDNLESQKTQHFVVLGNVWQVAQNLTSRPVKGMLTGPVTILNWSFPRLDVSRKEQVCYHVLRSVHVL